MTPKLIKTVSRRFVLHLTGASYFLALAVTLLAFSYLVYAGVNNWLTGGVGVVLGFGVLIPVAIWLRQERAALERLRRMSTPKVTYVFNDDGVSTHSDLGDATVKWDAILEVRVFPEAWLLMLDKRSYVTIPLQALTEEAMQFIMANVRKGK